MLSRISLAGRKCKFTAALAGMLVLACIGMGQPSQLYAQSVINLLRGGPAASSPVAAPVQYAAADGAAEYGTPDLSDWAGSWSAPQAIYDQGTYVDSEDYWDTGIGDGAGTTWTNSSAPGAGKGILVVDLQAERQIDRFSVFQMFSDGKTTHIQFFKHSATGATAPDASDAGWTSAGDEAAVGAGLDDTLNARIANPTKISVTPFTTRYLKLVARNDGSLGDASYIELKGVKAFGNATPPTATPAPTATSTATATATATDTPAPTATATATDTPVPTATPTATATATDTPVPTATSTATATDTPVPTATPIATATATDTPAPTATLTATATATDTPVPTATPTATATATATDTPILTATATNTPIPTATSTANPTATATTEATGTPTATATGTAATGTPAATATGTPTEAPTATETPEPTVTATATPTETATATPTNTPVAGGCAGDVQGAIEADNGFCPSRDGFAFANFADKLEPDDAALIDLYGADTVCKRGTLSEDGAHCTIDLSVSKLIASHQSTNYGNGYGMAVTSLRLFLGRDEQPAQFDPNAATTAQLALTDELGAYINRFSAQEISVRSGAADSGYRRSVPPGELLPLIRSELQASPDTADPFILILYDNAGASSQTLAPYRVVNLGGDRYDLYVYDNNFPGDDTRKVQFDLRNESWRYNTTIPGVNQLVDLSGESDFTQPDLRYLSAHAMRGLRLIGAENTGAAGAGEARLLATGNPLAYETQNCHSLTVGGEVVFNSLDETTIDCSQVLSEGNLQSLAISDGLDAQDNNREHNRLYGMSDGGDLQFNMVGQLGSGALQLDLVTDQGDLTQISAAPSAALLAAGVNSLNYSLALSPDGSGVSLNSGSPDVLAASQAGDAPFYAGFAIAERGVTENQPSASVGINDLGLVLGQPVQTTMDSAAGLFTLTSDRPVSFALEIQKLAPDGSAATFTAPDVVVDGVGAQLDFGSWQGGDEPLALTVDKDGDGFGNDAPQPIENEYAPVRVFLPGVYREGVPGGGDTPAGTERIYLPSIQRLGAAVQGALASLWPGAAREDAPLLASAGLAAVGVAVLGVLYRRRRRR